VTQRLGYDNSPSPLVFPAFRAKVFIRNMTLSPALRLGYIRPKDATYVLKISDLDALVESSLDG